MTREEPASPPPPSSPHAAASSTPARRRVLRDVSNASPSPLAAGDPNGAKLGGRKPGQKNFEKFSDLPARAKSTRRRSASVSADHAVTAFAPSIPRPARPVVAAARPAAAPVRAVVAAASLDEPPAGNASKSCWPFSNGFLFGNQTTTGCWQRRRQQNTIFLQQKRGSVSVP